MSCRHARVKRSRADRRQKRHPVLRAVGRTMAVLGVTLLGILATAYGAVALMCKGPSPTARDMFVTTMMETSAAKFVPRLFLSGAEIEAILHKNTVIEGETNTEAVEEFVPRNEEVPKDTIELLDVYGPTFKGKMMIVHDPSRIKVATLDRYGADLPGLKVEDFAKKYGATAAVNGGEFLDTNGVGLWASSSRTASSGMETNPPSSPSSPSTTRTACSWDGCREKKPKKNMCGTRSATVPLSSSTASPWRCPEPAAASTPAP